MITPTSRIVQNEDNSELNVDGIDPFLISALKCPRDRPVLFGIDNELEMFIKDKYSFQKEFPPMNRYQRMIVHKMAHYFKLGHVYLPDKRAVFVQKQDDSQIPVKRLVDLCDDEPVKPAVRLLKRPNRVSDNSVRILNKSSSSNNDNNNNSLKSSKENIISKDKLITDKLEEREKEYALARARIFNENAKKDYDDKKNYENEFNNNTLFRANTQDYNNFYPPNTYDMNHSNPPFNYNYNNVFNPQQVYYGYPYYTVNNSDYYSQPAYYHPSVSMNNIGYNQWPSQPDNNRNHSVNLTQVKIHNKS